MADIRTIKGLEVELRHVPSVTPRQTGFNGKRRVPAHVLVGKPGFEHARWSFKTVDEATSWLEANLKEDSSR